uniref:Uncharacterized protein n=1 Tax=viral metagenome TaxID=1070528 RepID=A0A6C0CMA3_9ZZZZ
MNFKYSLVDILQKESNKKNGLNINSQWLEYAGEDKCGYEIHYTDEHDYRKIISIYIDDTYEMNQDKVYFKNTIYIEFKIRILAKPETNIQSIELFKIIKSLAKYYDIDMVNYHTSKYLHKQVNRIDLFNMII